MKNTGKASSNYVEELECQNEKLKSLVHGYSAAQREFCEIVEKIDAVLYNAAYENYEKVEKIKDILDYGNRK